MLFNSFIFFVFLGLVLPIFYVLQGKKNKNIFLLLASYVFYGFWDWRFCLLLLFSTTIDYFVGRYMAKSNNEQTRKRLLLLSLFSNLSILGFFKYCNFFVDSFFDLLGMFANSEPHYALNIILPVGISFYTFQSLSYTIDIYKRKIKPTVNFIDFALFVAFFPQLVAGPIERAKTLLPQLSKKLVPTKTQVQQGIVLIVMGLFKKVIIGDTAGRYVDHVFGNMHLYKSSELIIALFLFGVQIYADFSGYSHIARGTAKLLGVELMKNFEQPYFSRNIAEFWKRWHISLSSWLRDYLYIPLGGNRKGVSRTQINIMITMLLGGLWHGASWNFVIWGGLHGLYLILHKLLKRNRKPSMANMSSFSIKDLVNILFTNILILFTWLFFRASTFKDTQLFLEKIWHWESSAFTYRFIGVAFTYGLMVFLLDYFAYKTGSHTFLLKLRSKPLIVGILTALFFVTVLYMFQSDNQPFIYFQF